MDEKRLTKHIEHYREWVAEKSDECALGTMTRRHIRSRDDSHFAGDALDWCQRWESPKIGSVKRRNSA
jgi:hypothetical protein